jgi:alpha-tubulin suppressor-like RCC1 family protein
MASPMNETRPVEVVDGNVPMTDATSVRGGYEVTCAVRTGGNVWCWGNGGDGQLGNGTAMAMSSATPVRVALQNGMPLANIVQVDGGYGHNCGRDTSGGVWCWGRNGSGQLGDGTTVPANRNYATPVLDAAGGTALTGVTDIYSGGDYTCAVKAGNQVWCWGRDGDGEFGDNMSTNHPSPVMIAQSTSIGAGNFHLCYLNADSSVSCAGANYHGQLGNGTGGAFNGPDVRVPAQVITQLAGPPLTGAAKVVIGGPMSCALMQDKTVQCWGDSFFGQTGTGTGSSIPQVVLAKNGTTAKRLENVDRLLAHYPRACAHTTAGTWWCWGRGRDGEFGDGLQRDRGLAELLTGVTCP